MKKSNTDDYYIEYLKRNFDKQTSIEQNKEDETPKEKIQKALKKSFEKIEQKYYSLV